MSELKVNSIKGVGASTAAITINNTDGTCTANLGNRQNPNLILNGAMRIFQRRGSLTGEGYSVDRMRTEMSTLDENVVTTQGTVASGTTPYSLGFRNTWKIQNGNQTSSVPTDVRISFQHHIEAQELFSSGWNYTDPNSKITISFWVKSSVAQNFYGLFQTNDGTRQNYPFETGSLTADTWTKITKTVPGNSGIQFDDDNESGLKIEINMIRGTIYTDNSVSLNTWAVYDSATRTPDQTTTWYSTNDATFEMTGLQLEVSDNATDFQFEPFQTTLRKCLRYYQKSYSYGVEPGATGVNSGMITGSVSDARTNRLDLGTRFETEFRSNPTMTIYRPLNATADRLETYGSGNGTSGTGSRTFTMRGLGRKGFAGFTLSTSTGGSIGYHYTGESEL